MRLTQYSNFALRTLQFLALHAPGIVTVDQVARAHGISKAHLVKVAYDLGQRGYIETLRGRNGGMRLSRPAEDISVGEIFALDGGAARTGGMFQPANEHLPASGTLPSLARHSAGVAGVFRGSGRSDDCGNHRQSLRSDGTSGRQYATA